MHEQIDEQAILSFDPKCNAIFTFSEVIHDRDPHYWGLVTSIEVNANTRSNLLSLHSVGLAIYITELERFCTYIEDNLDYFFGRTSVRPKREFITQEHLYKVEILPGGLHKGIALAGLRLMIDIGHVPKAHRIYAGIETQTDSQELLKFTGQMRAIIEKYKNKPT
jgi:hypothetical protein